MYAPGGVIHLFFEGTSLSITLEYLLLTVAGYFVVNHVGMAGKSDLFGQLWKEYSMSDSRYLTQDAFVLSMETITAVSPPIVETKNLLMVGSRSFGVRYAFL